MRLGFLNSRKFDKNELNFSGGPGVLPNAVLKQAAADVARIESLGLSILGVNHRSAWFQDVIQEANSLTRELLNVPSNYKILFMQGGSTLQFSSIPYLFHKTPLDKTDYLETGYWSQKAIAEAGKIGTTCIAWSGKPENFKRLPQSSELRLQKDAKYLHYVSNETVEGLQFKDIPGHDFIPRVCDMSSDLFSRPIDVNKFAMIYAHAQKNLGPAGATLVIVREDLLKLCDAKMPAIFNYRLFEESNSIYNTAPVFAIYVILLVLRWMKSEFGHLGNMLERNQEKADTVFRVIEDRPDFFQPRVDSQSRSRVNICLTLPSQELETEFLKYLANYDITGLEGHRSIGGIRISLYNAVTLEATQFLAEKMAAFCDKVH